MFTSKTSAIAYNKYNKKQDCNNLQAGVERLYTPRQVGDILAEMLSSNSPLAKGYRRFLASKENSAEKGGMA